MLGCTSGIPRTGAPIPDWSVISLTTAVLAGLASLVGSGWAAEQADRPQPDSIHLRCEPELDASNRLLEKPPKTESVKHSALHAGPLARPPAVPNAGSWQFDGQRSIVYAIPSNTAGFEANFTWEGFFLTPAKNQYEAETGIADRLITQFAFDQGNWTRLAIGLVADDEGHPRLSVELEGFEGRTFQLGAKVVSPDRWHHFALVHEGTPAAGHLRWYLDYQPTGEIFLGGQSNQNTLRPPGAARFTCGARLKQNGLVNRGFTGLLDEIRLTRRPLTVEEFLRCESGSESVVHLAEEPERDWPAYWAQRHEWARRRSRQWAPARRNRPAIDTLALQWLEDVSLAPDGIGNGGVGKPRWDPQSVIGDEAFLRRLSLVVRGRIPAGFEVEGFLRDERPDKRSRVIDRWLASDEWADGWVGYWQDVLAENPSVVFPTLNNSGAFRDWIYDSFHQNIPFDQFATELVWMQPARKGTVRAASAEGFGLATGNDVPMAMRAHVAIKAFAAVDLRCARCHDSPIDRFQQADLFLAAAYLQNEPLTVPATSVAASKIVSSDALIKTSLIAGQTIQPVGLSSYWLSEPETADTLRPVESGPRAELAALITSPNNSRFSAVIVNRVWQRYFGRALVEPVDQWTTTEDLTNSQLLMVLSAEFIESGYDLKQLARRILNTSAWQQPRSMRMSAEQLVDSLFVAVGKDFQAETLGVHATDPGAVQLPRPQRAWQFAALPNERDRPALGMPVNQTIVDLMTAFGWSGSRQQPRTVRESTTNSVQALMMFNSPVSQRIVRLSEDSAVTELSLQPIPIDEFVNRLYLRTLGRRPDEVEREVVTGLLSGSFADRLTNEPAGPIEPLNTFQPDWRKHLEPEQTRLMLQAQARVARGQPPTTRLTREFRERVEDVLWALINSPEFIVIP